MTIIYKGVIKEYTHFFRRSGTQCVIHKCQYGVEPGYTRVILALSLSIVTVNSNDILPLN